MEINYYEMVKSAETSGKFTKEIMWSSVQKVSDLMEEVKEKMPDLYYGFMREQYGLMHSWQYGEEFARYDVSSMKWHDREGAEREGEYWSCAQIKEATKDMKFPSSVTDWTKYVAFNTSATDLTEILSDEMILKVAYNTWFKDEDWTDDKDGYSPTKIWEYMCLKNTK
jgi:hypothetical protein